VSIRLALAGLWIPPALKRRKLAELAALTARALGVEPPALVGGWRARLAAYGRFTRDAAGRACRAGGEAARVALLAEGRAFGEGLRRELGVTSVAEALRAARVLYRSLGIDLRADAAGGIRVRRCLFAGYYTPEVCRLISALDSGVFAGLAGGGSLAFEQRLTEGAPACIARFDREVPA
jgi:hypothetical protein